MKLQPHICKATLVMLALPCFAVSASAQESSPRQDSVTLSEPVHTTLYPEIFCGRCLVPEWSRGYLLHREIEKNFDPANPSVTMYDSSGKKVQAGRIWDPASTSVSVITAGASDTGGILAGATGTMTDGSIQGFIAKTDLSGRTIQSVHTGQFTPQQVCEVPDGTVWTLGYDRESRHTHDASSNVLRHYSFEKGMLGSFVSLDSISKSPDGVSVVSDSEKSYLRCEKNRISVYLVPTAEYIEVDASAEKLARWHVDVSSVVGSEVYGLAVTEEGRKFLVFANDGGTNTQSAAGLYELKAVSGSPIASLTPVSGTVTVYAAKDTVPDGAFNWLWGAEGNSLVVTRKRDGDGFGLSWLKVLSTQATPD